MHNPNKIALIGAGGIGCHLAPILSRMHDIVIVDGDVYEPKNVERQFPALKHSGNKAMILAEMVQENTIKTVQSIPAYVKNAAIANSPEWRGVDMIVSGVDNNESRRILCDLADIFNVPLIMAGNEHEHGEAHLFVPEIYNPFDYHEFKVDPNDVPWGCNTDAVVELYPQTPIANFLAAGCAMHILLSWKKVGNPLNAVCYSRTDALSSSFARIRDCAPKEDES